MAKEYSLDIHPLCIDCGVDTEKIKEYFALRDDVWAEAVKAGKLVHDGEVLCIGCVERRLGRKLNAPDFTNAKVNRLGDHGERLRDRLTARAD